MTTTRHPKLPTRRGDEERDLAVVVLLALAVAALVAAWPHHLRPWMAGLAARVMGPPAPIGILEVAAVGLPLLALLLASPAVMRRRRDRKAGRCPQDPWFRQTGPPNR